MQDWLWASAADLGRGIEAGAIDPIELCEIYLSAIDAHPLTPRIYARVTHDRARAEAKAASHRANTGQRLSLLDGVPISWKDLFDTAGTATEAGTALLQGRVPGKDAEVLHNATAMGLVCLGKTHMSEIAFSGLGLNPLTATPPCINDREAVPGGSSSGAGASVAFGLAAAAIGSDTGGSVRIPSMWNDLVGLKTTHGRLSLNGVVPLCPRFDTVGPLTRNVEDAALLLAALEGKKAADLKGGTVAGLRIAALQTIVMDDMRQAPLKGFNQAMQALRHAGATITPIEVPELNQAFEMSGALYTAEAYSEWAELLEAQPEKMFWQILNRVRPGRDVLAHDYIRHWRVLEAIRTAYAKATAGFDVVISPGSPILPPNAQRLLEDEAYYLTENLLALRNTRVANMMGLASLVLPTPVPSVGLLLNIGAGQEEKLLRIGTAIEAALA